MPEGMSGAPSEPRKSGSPEVENPAEVASLPDDNEDSALSEVMGRPPPLISRGLLYLIVFFTTVAFAWAAFNEVDVVVSVNATVVPEGKLKIIQPPFAGTVRDIGVRQGDNVRQGDILIVYESPEVSRLLGDLKASRAELKLAQSDLQEGLPRRLAVLQALIRTQTQAFDRRSLIHNAQLDKYDEQMRRLNLEVESARGRLRLMNREVEVNQKLAEKGIVAERRLLELMRIREESAIEIESLKSNQREARMNKEIEAEQFNLEVEQQISQIADLEQQIEEMNRAAQERHDLALIQYEKARDLAALNLAGVDRETIEASSQGSGATTNVAKITAPVDGVIAEVGVRNPGESIDRGQTLVTLVPQGVSLIAEMNIPDRDIGKIRDGQAIRFKFDAFPFAEYGVLTGEVQSISPSATTVEETEVSYRATSALSQDYFRQQEEVTPLLPGMKATAEIKTDKRTVLSLILKPFAELVSASEAER